MTARGDAALGACLPLRLPRDAKVNVVIDPCPVCGISGTGIGLYLTRELVHLHGGRVRVVSQVGHGSTFTVVLPAEARYAAARDAA